MAHFDQNPTLAVWTTMAVNGKNYFSKKPNSIEIIMFGLNLEWP